jgi:DNA-binding NarL/FixJ family response regulator
MDIAMPGLNGLEATARICKEFPLVKVIILSMYDGEDYVNEAIKSGAIGYIVKGDASFVLEDAIRKVARGEKYFSPKASKHIGKGKTARKSSERELVQTLTPRQREILQLIAERHTTKEIAYMLNISVKTVETHRAQLMARLGIHDVPGLVRLAIRARLVLLEE